MNKKKNGASGFRQLLIPLVALGILIVFNLIRDVSFFSVTMRVNNSGNIVLTGNLISVIDSASELAIIAMGMTLVTAACGGQDISVGAVGAISGAVLVKVLQGMGGITPLSLLLGFLLYRHRMDARIAAALFVICTVALPIITRTLLQTDIDPSGLTGYNSPLVVLQSASAYSLMLRIKRPAKGLIEDLDRCTFGIYLIHMIFIRMLMCEMGFDPFDLGVGCFIALAVIFYFTSANITYVLKKVRIFDFL